MFKKQDWCKNGSVCDTFVEWNNFLKVVTSSRCDLSYKSHLQMRMYAGGTWLRFLIKHLYLIGVWSGVD